MKFSPKACLKTFKGVKTVKQALMVKAPSVGMMVRQYGDTVMEGFIEMWLINLNESINLKRPLKEHQMEECAILVLEEFRHLTIADINIIFRKAKLGEYGELYETLSIDKVLTWFREYFEVRCDVAGSMTRQEADKFKYLEQQGQRSSLKDAATMQEVMHDYKLNKMQEEFGAKPRVDNDKKQEDE